MNKELKQKLWEEGNAISHHNFIKGYMIKMNNHGAGLGWIIGFFTVGYVLNGGDFLWNLVMAIFGLSVGILIILMENRK